MVNRHFTPGQEKPLIPAKAFYEQLGNALKNQEPEEKLPLEAFSRTKVQEHDKDCEPAQRTIELGRMQRNA